MTKPKLTPTHADKVREMVDNKTFQNIPGEPHITPPHEPLSGENYVLRQVLNDPAAPQPVADPNYKKIAVLGTAPSSRMLAPFNDPSWTIWCCSPGNMGQMPRVDVWFELHGNLLWPENKHYGEPYLKWLNEQTFPLYMQHNAWVPRAMPFPYRELVNEFGPYFFTSSFAWMIALAMVQGAKEIAMFGIDMASRNEYILQRPGAYFFFMEAKRRGIKMLAPYESDIMQPPGLYGYSEVTQYGRKLLARKVELETRIRDLKAQRDNAAQQTTYLEGALEDLDYFESIFGGVQNNSLIGN